MESKQTINKKQKKKQNSKQNFVVTRKGVVGIKGGQWYKLPVIRQVRMRDVMYNMMVIANAVWYI